MWGRQLAGKPAVSRLEDFSVNRTLDPKSNAPPRVSHSIRNVIAGSMRTARRAGK